MRFRCPNCGHEAEPPIEKVPEIFPHLDGPILSHTVHCFCGDPDQAPPEMLLLPPVPVAGEE